MLDQKNIRNFVIIAHIDHGKSTLADRMIELTHTVAQNQLRPQMLDTMDLEQERGITIKLQPVRMAYKMPKSKLQISNNPSSNLEIRNSDLEIESSEFILNLIDTPGHVDFAYEVSRSLAAVEGAVLVVDATKGIQAQTLANLDHALANNLVIIPVINKIDLPNAMVDEASLEISELLKIDPDEIIKVSAKTGENVEQILDRIVQKVPAPSGEKEKPLKALIFDSIYDSYRGVIAYVKIFDGAVKAGEKLKFLATKKQVECTEVGQFKLKYDPLESLGAGEIGYIITGEKNIDDVKVGDTITLDSPAEVSPIAGYKIPQSMVFASLFTQGGEPNHLRNALLKLKLNDSSLYFEPENSQAFGHGFKCGFLGLLHLEIVKERLEREYGLDLIVTQPSVLYKIDNSGSHPSYEEPWVDLEIITPTAYLGAVMELVQAKRGVYLDTKYFGDRAILKYDAPLAEIIVDFHDKLKSVSQGYASQNYDLIGHRQGDLVKLDVIIAGETIEEFNKIVPRERAQTEAKSFAVKLKELIPKQMFEVTIQIAVGGKILAREDISAMRKDVIAKLYGGDRTRKDKLLKKQAAGKKKMKKLGRLDIPDEVFMEILKR